MTYDIVIQGGMIYDGTGSDPKSLDIAIKDDKISEIAKSGSLDTDEAQIIDASGLAVSPGFINVLSWSNETLIHDGRAMSTITQGVTLEIMGEGMSWGPLNPQMKKDLPTFFTSGIDYNVEWDTLGEYMLYLQNKGIATNIASFVGAATLRMYVMNMENRPPTEKELQIMQDLAEEAMQEGALGIGSSLIYPPAFYAKTDELIALCKVASRYGGTYISHMRSEGSQLLEGIEELITIAREANLPAEIYHLKAAGKSNWNKLEPAISKIESAQKEGLKITTDMYNYPRAGTGLDSCLPPSLHEGGRNAFVTRLKDPSIRSDMKHIMDQPTIEWENLYYEAGPGNIWPVSFEKEHNRKYIGKSISEIALESEKDPRDVVIDLLIDDESRVGTIYQIMDEANVRRKIQLPYMSFGSDGSSMSPEGIFLRSQVHPRAYGNFARLLGKYVRDEKILSLTEAIRKMTSLPATNLNIAKRGLLKKGYFADIAIFDPETISDKATYENPHQLSVGMHYVLVNGILVLKEGKHTDAMPGRFVRGPGYNSL